MKLTCQIQNESREITKAIVILVSNNDRPKRFRLDRKTGLYVLETDVKPNEKIHLIIRKKHCKPVQRHFFASENVIHITLGDSEVDYLMVGKKIEPVRKYEDVFYIDGHGEEFEKSLAEFGLEKVSFYKGKKVSDNHVYRKMSKNLKRKTTFKDELKKIDDLKGVNYVSPIADLNPNNFAIYSHLIKVKFNENLSAIEIKKIIANCNLEKVEINRSGEYIVAANKNCGYDLFDHINELYETGKAKYVYPIKISNEIAYTGVGNFLWDGQYSHKVIEVSAAWDALAIKHGINRKFGLGDLIVAVADFGLVPFGGVNPAFTGDVTLDSGLLSDKEYLAQDFRPSSFGPNNDTPIIDDGEEDSHGVNVAGIIAANQEASGSAGVAPNVSLFNLIATGGGPTLTTDKIIEGFRWAAGLSNYTNGSDSLTRLSKGFDILASSLGYQYLSTFDSPDQFKILIEDLLYRGRNGRGALLLFAAGNESTDFGYTAPTDGNDQLNYFASYEGVLSIGATSFYPDYDEERKTIYSNTGKIDFCAPSSNLGGSKNVKHDPDRLIGTWTPTFVGKGELPGDISHTTTITSNLKEAFPLIETVTLATVFDRATARPKTQVTESLSPGESEIDVVSSEGFEVGVYAYISDSTTDKSNWFKVSAVATDKITVDGNTPLTESFTTNAKIVGAAKIPNTKLSADVAAGLSSITVNSSDGFTVGMRIRIYNVTTSNEEFFTVSSLSTGVINFMGSLAYGHLEADDVYVIGLTTVTLPSTSGYSTSDNDIILEYVAEGRSYFESVNIQEIEATALHLLGISYLHHMDNNILVKLRRNYYRKLGGTSIMSFPIAANYNPSGMTLINPITGMSDDSIEVSNPGDFEKGVMLKIDDGTNTEWRMVKDIVGNTLKFSFSFTLDNSYAVANTTITGYPGVRFGQANEGDILKIESVTEPTIYAEALEGYDFINSCVALKPVLPAISVGSWTNVTRVPGIYVTDNSDFDVDDDVLIGDPNFDLIAITEDSETSKIAGKYNSDLIILDDNLKGFDASSGTLKLRKGNFDFTDHFGGTSSACPTVAGVIALMISANPNLTWLEIIELLKTSSDKIDEETLGYHGDPDDANGVTDDRGNIITFSPSDADPSIRPLRGGQWKNKAGNYIYNADGTPSGEADITPYFSDWYGYGRVNAKLAVQAAIDYDQTERDLVIRDTLLDDGTTGGFTGVSIDSPDIWVRNINPVLDDDFSLLDYGHSPPHQKPIKTKDRYLYARIKNIGALKSNLNAKVRFYAVLDDPGTQFKFPDHFENKGDVALGLLPSVKLIDEIEIVEDDIAAGGIKVVHVLWEKDFSNPETDKETNILVEITPHDGPFFGLENDGSLIGNNNNITRKKIEFRNEIDIRGTSGKLPISIAIPSDAVASLITTDFEVDIIDTVLLTTEDVKITMTYKLHGNPEEVVEYRYAGGSWGFNTAPSGSWASLNAPLIEPFGVADLALGDKNNIRFKGSFNVDGTVDYVKIKCDYTNINGDVRTDFKTVDIRVEYISDGIEDSEPIESSKAYFFTEFPLLIHGQSYPDVFGPDNSTPNTVFRTTNKFWTDVDAKAFAVVSGQILVVPTTNPLIVNVVLKPRNQGSIDFLDVKYFVYRGILKDQLIDSSDDQKVVAAGTNAFVDSIWDTQEKINDAIENADLSDGIGPGSVTDEPSALALGVQYVFPATEPWHVEKLDAESLDQLFFDEASDYKFPIVRAGEEFGKFRNTSIGFDIILNDPSSVTTFAEVRGVENVITVTALGGSPTDLEKLQDRSERAKILEYMDPAAFYGIHYYSGINAYDAGGTDTIFNSKDTNNAYDAIINKFLNKNRTYIDIRNENEYSFNYYDNYTASGADIKLSFDSGVLPATEIFGTSGWPIRIVENAELESGETGKKNAVYIEFPKGDNTAPLLYKSFASDFKRFPKKPRNKNRFLEVDFDGANLYSETIKLGLPNREDNGDTTAVSWYMKLNYIKRNLVSNPASAGMVINGQDTFDHLFPVVDNVVWNSSNQILFNAGFQSTFFEKSDFSCFGELGFAKEANRVVFYMTPEEVNFQPSKNMRLYKRVIGGVSNKTSFFEVLKNIFPDFSLQKGELTISATSKFYLNYEDGTKRRERESDKHNFICVGMTKAEFDALLASATASNIDSDLHTPLLVVKSKSVLADDNGAGFIKYELGVAGLDVTGNYVVAPATVEAYSIDNTMLTSSDFADQETSTDNENPDCIEFIDVNGPERNTVFGQVIKRVSLFKEANGTVTRKWKMYTDSGADLNYENTDVSNFGDPLNNTMQIELPVGVRVIMLECKILPVETLGSVNYIRVVTYYNGDFREGYISENAIKNSTDERTLNTENIEPDEQFDALVNDIKLDTELARRITLDPIYIAETTYPHSVDFTNLLSSLEAELDPSDPSSFITKYQSLSETDKRSWMAGLKSIESYFSFNFYQDALKGFRIDYPATTKKFMNVFSETTMPIKTVKADTSPVNVLFLPLTAEWSGYRAASLEPYGPNLQDFFENKASTLLNEIFGDNGTSYDNGGLGTADDEFTAIIGELKNIRKYLQSMAVDGVVYPLDENVLETKEAKWFLDDAHDDAYLDTITDIIFVWSETWKKDANPNHLKTDFRAGYIGVDCSMGFVNSNNVFVVLAHELNVGDGNVLGLADDTHTYDSNSLIVKNGVNNTKFVSHTSWEYVKENDFQTFNGHGFHPVASYLDAQGKILGREEYSPTKNICDFLQRNPSIGVIYAQYIIDKLKTL